MARLQDFQTVTPTSSDKLLVVQSQGQGLVPYGSKLDSANPTGSGTLAMNKKADTTLGTNSVTVGYQGTASGNYAMAEGYRTTASGNYSHSFGESTIADGNYAVAEGADSKASGNFSHAHGWNTRATNRSQMVFGECNDLDPNSANPTQKGTYIEIVGKGTTDSNRSNARTLDWSGNEVLAGNLKINGSQHVYGTEVLENIGANETKTYTIPSSMFANSGVYILAFGSSYAVGSVYILSIKSSQPESVIFTELKSSSFITLSSTAKDKFTVTTGQAAFNVSLTRIG